MSCAMCRKLEEQVSLHRLEVKRLQAKVRYLAQKCKDSTREAKEWKKAHEVQQGEDLMSLSDW